MTKQTKQAVIDKIQKLINKITDNSSFVCPFSNRIYGVHRALSACLDSYDDEYFKLIHGYSPSTKLEEVSKKDLNYLLSILEFGGMKTNAEKQVEENRRRLEKNKKDIKRLNKKIDIDKDELSKYCFDINKNMAEYFVLEEKFHQSLDIEQKELLAKMQFLHVNQIVNDNLSRPSRECDSCRHGRMEDENFAYKYHSKDYVPREVVIQRLEEMRKEFETILERVNDLIYDAISDVEE